MTIKEIAKLAGVSTATVSRIINDSGKVKEETRIKVQNIIDQHNYRPNQVARTLFKKKSNIIGIIVPDLSNMFYSQIIEGIQKIIDNTKYSLMISFSAGADNKKYIDFIQKFQQENVDGIITSAFSGEYVTKIKIPIVMYDSANIEDNIIRIASDNKAGGKLISRLLNKNIKKVLIQHLDLSLPTVAERFNSLIAELNKRDITYNLVAVDGLSKKQSSQKVLENIKHFDAVISVNDEYAADIIKESRLNGFKIPEDFQLVGYDNTNLAQYTDPTISTIDQQAFEIGKAAVKRLIDRIDGNKSTENTIIPVRALKNESTI
ncbi:LacI family DNA-binding transcriptional regulator [Lactobacillus mulieris]|uniref:LacI family transcriptional regulator n=1 Tax=Lactobacillus mulieris TaxID=2508708 RepID=A0AAW5WYN1_9LACO|nr:LacI family DNA-binding transcriptional regulator [Lactobacillus mulieris]MCZ3621684.1 LacI family transcriptional regulator [Lactobacillus mulieris]MCZ3623040.1 LacI family transcriptional regulator [Lactobacillus mulieris]MCZ3635691.1 LacI family transcriptional regulator [Lactobacillus mulieris]MCZ3690090.1 LacI family transcriptional regulator [Lactobacillus mulieris]MCZ3696028.1 LacI family transcriptional regulator [Lactobacillus mulieris]